MSAVVPPKPDHPPLVGADPFADAGQGLPLRVQRQLAAELPAAEVGVEVLAGALRFLRFEADDLLMMSRTPLLAVIVAPGGQQVTAAGLREQLALRGIDEAAIEQVAASVPSRRWGPVAGIVSLPDLFTADGPVLDPAVFHRALRLSRRSGVPVISIGTQTETRACLGHLNPVCLVS